MDELAEYANKHIDFASSKVCHILPILPFPSAKGCINSNS